MQPFDNHDEAVSGDYQGLAQATKYSWRKTAQGTLAAYEKTLQQANKR